jgi:hypothetical protein
MQVGRVHLEFCLHPQPLLSRQNDLRNPIYLTQRMAYPYAFCNGLVNDLNHRTICAQSPTRASCTATSPAYGDQTRLVHEACPIPKAIHLTCRYKNHLVPDQAGHDFVCRCGVSRQIEWQISMAGINNTPVGCTPLLRHGRSPMMRATPYNSILRFGPEAESGMKI